jgi:polyhydroxybutyrate depolymerase
MMCYRLAAELSERIAAIAPVSGAIAVDNYQPRFPMPVLHIHGTLDNLVPYDGAGPRMASLVKFRSVEDTIAACVEHNGCCRTPKTSAIPCTRDALKITRKEYPAGANGCEVILYVVEGGGHTWPGSAIGGGLLGAYTLNMRATDVIWDFFQRHQR